MKKTELDIESIEESIRNTPEIGQVTEMTPTQKPGSLDHIEAHIAYCI